MKSLSQFFCILVATNINFPNIECQKPLFLSDFSRNLLFPKADHVTKLESDETYVRNSEQSHNTASELRFNSNTSTTEVCAGPEICPLCWNPVLFSIITNMNYTLLGNNNVKQSYFYPKKLYETEIPNNTSETLIANATFSKMMLNKFQWNFQESQNISVRTILSVKIPFPTPEQDSDSSVYLDIMEVIPNDKIIIKKLLQYNGNQEIVINPSEVAIATAYSKWIAKYLIIPFETHVEFISPKMAACWICGNNGYVCLEASLSGQNILDILLRKGFRGEIVDIRDNSVVAPLHGTFKGSYGTQTTFVIKKKEM